MLLQKDTDLKLPFPTLPSNVYPVFSERSPVLFRTGSISRLQIPITLAFARTDYKVQGATFTSAIVDLKRPDRVVGNTHKRFCSTYVQLSHLRSFAGLGLLQPIDMSDIANQPHPSLALEDARLEKLSNQTMHNWSENIEENANRGMT